MSQSHNLISAHIVDTIARLRFYLTLHGADSAILGLVDKLEEKTKKVEPSPAHGRGMTAEALIGLAPTGKADQGEK